MDKDQLDALFAMQAAFPDMTKTCVNEGAGGRLIIRIDLTPEQVEFWRAAQQMMAPVIHQPNPL